MTVIAQPFDEAVQEFIEKTDETLGKEVYENFPPPAPSPYPQDVPVHSTQVFNVENIRNYAYSIGDGNPLFTDPAYAATTRYGGIIAPNPMLALVRYPSAHGADRPQGYPVANFISGAAWEFYDVVRPGSRFKSSKVAAETFEKSGAQGRLLFLISDVHYWDQTGELKAKVYGTQIHVPIAAMESGRAMSVERLGEHMMYERKAQSYDDESVGQIVETLEAEERRGSEPRYWEDVEVGEELPTIVVPPFTIQDMIAMHRMRYAAEAANDGARQARAFSPVYRRAQERPDFVRTHPVTRWTYVPWDEHEDVFLATYRGQPGPFDFGVQRAQIPQRLMSNWMGDDGFMRKMYTAFRRPVFYGDTTWYKGKVVKKYTVTESGEAGDGGVGGEATYHAVAIEIEGTNQAGEMQCPGFATVYLPSREYGPVQLPVPHPARPPFVPFETYRRIDWY